jgi:phosphoribosylformimino-5-aminoimidazole carboxamide ribotide isomerase
LEIIPAVDMKQGGVVRLIRGDPKLSKSYSFLGSPLNIAKEWVSQGAKTLHIVDLDAALGTGSNFPIIKELISTLNKFVDFEVGGGIRDLKTAIKFFELNVKRIMLGTLAFSDRKTLQKLIDNYGNNRIMVSLDHYNGQVKTHGWKTSSNVNVLEAMSQFVDIGIRFFLITSIEKDGTLTNPDIQVLSEACKMNKVNIIAAGGISNIEHVIGIKKMGVYGVVIGKAIYENKISLKAAINIAIR